MKKIIYKKIYKLKKVVLNFLFQRSRKIKFRLLSNCKNIKGRPVINQPTQFMGEGNIFFGKNVNLGIEFSPYFYNGYGYIDVRALHSRISIGDNVSINNNFVLVSEGDGIEIGENTIIGTNVEITDTNSHDLDPVNRILGAPKTCRVKIGKNVFIGGNVKILKGVVIGDNTVIGNSSVVTKSLPENTIAAGNPAKVIRQII